MIEGRVAAAAATTTFDSGTAPAAYTLSGGNLTATHTGGFGAASVISIASHSSGKFYCEATASVYSGFSNEMAFGIAVASSSRTTDLGFDANLSAAILDSGLIIINSSSAGTNSNAFVQGDTVSMAVDFDNNLFWFRIIHSGVAGNWNNDVIGNQNPVGAVGGRSISGLSGAKFIAAGADRTSDVWVLNAGGSSYLATAPSGFGNW